MKRLALLLALLPALAIAQDQRQHVMVVVGASGSEEFEKPFQMWADRWEAAAKKGNAGFTKIAVAKDNLEPKSQLQAWIKQNAELQQPIWLILIGHGTFDGKVARFNLQGPDVSAAELKDMLQPIAGQLAIINCTSSSGPFLAELAAPQRVVITAAQSGHEYNFAHLGDYLSAAIADPAGDLDKDEQTSLLEAYLLACSRLREFYSKDGRLATEHALLDDNGDKQGTPADWFQGLRVVKRAKAGAVDGELARQFVLVRSEREAQLPAAFVEERAKLERELSELRQRKGMLAEADYLAELEPLLVKIAKLSAAVPPPTDKSSASPKGE